MADSHSAAFSRDAIEYILMTQPTAGQDREIFGRSEKRPHRRLQRQREASHWDRGVGRETETRLFWVVYGLLATCLLTRIWCSLYTTSWLELATPLLPRKCSRHWYSLLITSKKNTISVPDFYWDAIYCNDKINDFMVFNYNFSEHDNVDFFINFLKAMSTRLNKIPQSYLVNEVLLCVKSEFPRISSTRENTVLLQPSGKHGQDHCEKHILVHSAE